LYFKEAVEFIKAAVDKGQNVLVHCFAGVSRSCTIVIAYLVRFFGMEVYSALNFVKRKRPWVNPNYGFYAQLKKYYQQLKDKKVIR
jgi:protein-tyrosine phosphatase